MKSAVGLAAVVLGMNSEMRYYLSFEALCVGKAVFGAVSKAYLAGVATCVGIFVQGFVELVGFM